MNKFIVAATLSMVLAGCSAPSDKEEVARLKAVTGEWTHEQTEDAIDLYLRGLKCEDELLEKNFDIQAQINFFDEKKCSRDVLKERRAEIDKARKELKDKRDRLERRD